MSATPAAAPAPGVYAKAPTQVLGRRAVALIVDAIIVGILTSPISITNASIDDGKFSVHYSGLAWIVIVLAPVIYWWVLESAFGATVGKWITGIRVRTVDGQEADVGKCLVRNIIRIVPFYWLVG